MWVNKKSDPFVTLSYDNYLIISRSNFKKPYPMNRMDNWIGTKGMWVYRKSGFKLWSYTWPLLWVFNVKFEKKLYIRYERTDRHGTKGMWANRMLDLPCYPHLWPWPWIFNFGKSRIPVIGWSIDIRRKGYLWWRNKMETFSGQRWIVLTNG